MQKSGVLVWLQTCFSRGDGGSFGLIPREELGQRKTMARRIWDGDVLFFFFFCPFRIMKDYRFSKGFIILY